MVKTQVLICTVLISDRQAGLGKAVINVNTLGLDKVIINGTHTCLDTVYNNGTQTLFLILFSLSLVHTLE